MYLLKLAMRPWRVAPMSQIFSSLAVGFLLCLGGFLFWLQSGLRPILYRLQGEQVITAYVQPNIETKDEEKLLETVRSQLDGARSLDIQFITAHQFVSLLKNHYSDLGRELEDLGKEMNQVVPRYVSITGILADSALEKIRNIPGIESAESSKDRYRQIVGAFSAVRWLTRVLMGGVFFALITGLIHLIRMNSYLHHDALSLMKLWGARRRTLVSPGMLSGLSLGFLGGMIASAGWLTLGMGLTHHVQALSSVLNGIVPAQASLALVLWLVGLVIGGLAGIMGSGSVGRESSRTGLSS